MANTHCSYQVKSKKKDGNSVVVVARFFEGGYKNVSEPDPDDFAKTITVNRYVPRDIIGDPVTIIFDKYPVSDSEINKELADLLTDISQLKQVG